MAGLIEGEGSIVISPNNRVTITVQMTDRDVIERLASLVNRNVWMVKNSNPNWTQAYTVAVGAKQDVRLLLEALLPWFGQRRTTKALQALEILRQ